MSAGGNLKAVALWFAMLGLVLSACEFPVPQSSEERAAAAAAKEREALKYIAPELQDERIDFALLRSDANCGPDFNPPANTQVWSAHYVVDGKLGKNCFGRISSVLVDAWRELVAVTPPAHLDKLGLFVGYSNVAEIDADESYVGFARRDGAFAQIGQILIDIDHAFADPEYLTKTLVHEMGHILSVDAAEWSYLAEGERCLGYVRNRSCFNKDSMMQQWVDDFWGDNAKSLDPDEIPTREAGRFRCKLDDGFWNMYSASSPVEDFAESYAAFVLRAEPNSERQQARHEWFESQQTFVEARERSTQFGRGPRTWRAECG